MAILERPENINMTTRNFITKERVAECKLVLFDLYWSGWFDPESRAKLRGAMEALREWAIPEHSDESTKTEVEMFEEIEIITQRVDFESFEFYCFSNTQTEFEVRITLEGSACPQCGILNFKVIEEKHPNPQIALRRALDRVSILKPGG